ncbi:MAG: serine/threonine protein kinase [Solirubrobacterales bacterium]|nr:serine/threonine protein kinase [Solirubrobacterales bacterium]
MFKSQRWVMVVVAALLLGMLPAAAEAKARRTKANTPPAVVRDALFVGNNWDGTIDIVDPASMKRLKRLNAIPDIGQRMAEISADPVRLAFFIAIAQQVGEGHNQYVDDTFGAKDGRTVFVSRPSLADVVAIDVATGAIRWRRPVEGHRSDHMAISPDGTRLLVSASTARKVHVIDTATGRIITSFASGDTPHESNFSADGKTIYHASIGTVYTPTDEYALDASKGERVFEVIDAKTYEIRKRLDIGKILRTFGFPGMSSAVRPMAVAPDERYVYLQLSFLHGFVEFDLQRNRPLRIATLPMSAEAAGKRRDEYLLDSAHHGLAMNRAGTKLCVAGTVSDYAAIVDRKTFSYTIGSHGSKPYWATNSADAGSCIVSYSGDDRIARISYATGKETGSLPVGDHPQRVRVGVVRRDAVG